MGGTIASVARGAREAGVLPALDASDLLETTGDLAGRATLVARTVRRMPSSSFTFDDVLGLARLVRSAFDEGSTGVVVTQGTDNIEETAFALDLLVDDERPIVVTGAMRSADAPGADGPANVRAAILVAADVSTRGLGTLVVMDDQVHAARFVRKTHSSLPSAFASPGAGPWAPWSKTAYAWSPGSRRSVSVLLSKRCPPWHCCGARWATTAAWLGYCANRDTPVSSLKGWAGATCRPSWSSRSPDSL